MSNRDGRGAKLSKGKKVSLSKPGQLCPRCRENKLSRMYDKRHHKKHWRFYAVCENPRCHFTNF